MQLAEWNEATVREANFILEKEKTVARIGILGGSFHPFHNGHLLLGKYCIDQEIVDEVWFIPTGVSYLKKDVKMLSGEERLRLLELGIQGYSHMKALDIEIKRAGNTYTYETLEELNRAYPEHDFYFMIGADCLFQIENWYQAERIFSSCTILAAQRDGVSKRSMQKKSGELKKRFSAKILLIDFPEMDISSTEIRRRIHAGERIDDLVPAAEAEEILRLGFFR